MQPSNLIAILGLQVFTVGALVQWWAGVHLIRKEQRPEGWAFLVFAVPQILLWSYGALRGGWVAFGLAVVFPAAVSIAVYRLYERKEQSRAFIWIIFALEIALFVLAVSLDFASTGEGSAGYWGLAASALASSISVVLWRKYTLRTPRPSARQRATSSCWATVGTILGLTVGGGRCARGHGSSGS